MGLSVIPAGSGDLVGPASSTDNAIARFDGTTGKLVQNSAATISDAGVLTCAGVIGAMQSAVIATSESTATFNSTSYVDSTALQLTLEPGTYWIEWRGVIGDSGGAGTGTKCRHNFSGTGTFSGLTIFGNQDGANPPSFPTYLGFPAGSVSATTGEWAVGAAGQDIHRKVKLVVTVSGVLSVQKAQNAATASTLTLYVGSYLNATRVA